MPAQKMEVQVIDDSEENVLALNSAISGLKNSGNIELFDQPYPDCFARSCKHLVGKHCDLYTVARPPIVIIDGRCMGFEI